MQIWTGDQAAPHFPHGCAVTIGNFDGVHIGHKHILESLKKEAGQRGLATVLMTFEPSPKEFFASQSGAGTMSLRVTSLQDKLKLLVDTNCLDGIWILPFNQNLATISAQQFIDQVLLHTLDVRFLLIGDDFCFGADRKGDIALLKQQKHFETQAMPSILVQDRRASSSDIRMALQQGEFEQANRILGHEFFISGTVIEGKKLARQLGCPTANIYSGWSHYPLNGVFAVEVVGNFGRKAGVANLGLNPTVSNTPEQKLEVHLFDFDQDLYGQQLTIFFKKKIRNELKFPDLETLKKQMHQDEREARAYLLSLGRKYD
jgi:riboflavin kinase/FMN adenylyltransferase